MGEAKSNIMISLISINYILYLFPLSEKVVHLTNLS